MATVYPIRKEDSLMATVLTPQEISEKALPSTVILETVDANGQQLGYGSGFFVQDGLIATNLHVVEGAYQAYATVVPQNTRHDIEGYTAINVETDLIILKVNDTGKVVDKPILPLGDSANLKQGDTIYAVGNPAGFEGTISNGIISGVRPLNPARGLSHEQIQITAPISPGSSGGAVINQKGEVIGVSVYGVHSVKPITVPHRQDEQYINLAQNLNFAIPASYLKALLDQSDKVAGTTPLKDAKLERVKWLGELEWIGTSSYTFPLYNLYSKNVENVSCSVIFKDQEGTEIGTDFVVFPGRIPAWTTKWIIRLSRFDTAFSDVTIALNTQQLQDMGIIHDKNDLNTSAVESFLLGLADLLLDNTGNFERSPIVPRVKRLMHNCEVKILDFDIVN